MTVHPLRESFSTWLTQEIQARDWSQRIIADKAGVSASGVGRWVRGESVPKPEHIPGLARALGLPDSEILSRMMPRTLTEREISLAERLAVELGPGLNAYEVRLFVLLARAYRQWEEEMVAGGVRLRVVPES